MDSFESASDREACFCLLFFLLRLTRNQITDLESGTGKALLEMSEWMDSEWPKDQNQIHPLGNEVPW